jgi:hypothetical protein
MPDRKKDELDIGSDFDFEKIGEYETPSKGGSDASSDDIDFANFGAGDTDKDFGFGEDGGFGGSADNDPFAVPADGPDPFDFGGPPSPDSAEFDTMTGDPDSEFGDFGKEDSETSKPGFDPFAEDHSGEASASSTYDHDAIDPFASNDDTDHDEHAGAGEEQSRAGKKTRAKSSGAGQSKVVQYGVAAAVVLVGGFVGYTKVLPMFMPHQQVVAQTDADVGDNTANFPTDLPGKTSNVSAEERKDEPKPVVAKVEPSATAKANDQQVGSLDLAATETSPSPVKPADQPALTADMKPGDAVKVADPKTPDLAAGKNDQTAEVSLDHELTDGSDRGGIVSMKGDPADAKPEAVKEAPKEGDLAAVNARIDDIARRIGEVEAKVASLSAPAVTAVPSPPVKDDQPEVADLPAAADDANLPAPAVGVVAPLKPPIIREVILRGVGQGGDMAWLGTSKGLVEVKVGDSVEKAGVIQSFQNYRGRWIAVTDKGIILPK